MSGVFEGWAGDAAANDQFIQTEVISLNYLALYSRKSSTDSLQTIYPSPSASIAAAQSNHVTRSQIFGGQVLPGRNRGDFLEFSLDLLRRDAARSLSIMDLQPAQ